MNENDANTMNPGSVFTGIMNAEKKALPTLSLSGPDPRSDSDYDPEQLKDGMKEESEHSSDPAIQKFITKTHLDKDPLYYSEDGEE
jgi:hypothetical protein